MGLRDLGSAVLAFEMSESMEDPDFISFFLESIFANYRDKCQAGPTVLVVARSFSRTILATKSRSA